MTRLSVWDELADAALTHDQTRELHAWAELLCTSCLRETRLPGEEACADCFIAAAHRRADQDRFGWNKKAAA